MMKTYMERLNPVWIKEMRQMEQSLLFKIAYILMILWSVASSLFFLSVAPDLSEMSKVIFALVYSGFLFCSLLVVPAQILFSSNRRWSLEKTEFLQLSSLRPGQIVLGRLWIAITQIGVFLSVFLPFIALLLLIPGLNYTNIFLSLYVAVLASIVASAVAIATGWLLPHPLMNTILSLVVLMFFMSVAGTLLSISVSELNSLNWSEVLIAAGINTYLAFLIGGGAVITAILRLRHPEENKSAPLRVLILCSSILTSVISILIGVFSGRGEPALAFLFVGYLILYPLHAVLVTEPNTVGRRVYYDYKQGRSKFSMFSMPTGGNAVLFSTSLFFVFCFTLFIIDANEDEVILAGVNTAMVAYFSMLYLSGFFYRWFENWVARLICLVAGPILLSIISLLPVMIAGFTEEPYFAKLSPFFLMAASFQGEGSYGFIGASLLAITAFIINVPRMTDASRRLKAIREKDAA